MFTVFEISIFLIALGILLVIAWTQLFAPDLKKFVDQDKLLTSKLKEPNLKWKKLEELLEKGGTGDLVFFCGDTRGERICRAFNESIFSHVGLLLRENDVLYVWEADLGQGSKGGARLIRLDQKLERYHGYPYVGWRQLKDGRPSTESLLKVIEKYKHLEFDHRMLSWWFNYPLLLPFMWAVKNRNQVFCSELVALTLQDLKVLQGNVEPSWYCPEFFRGDIYDLIDGCKYGEELYVSFKSLRS